MSKFNPTPTIRTTNKCGHPAYAMQDKLKLVTQVLTSFFNESKFYGDNSDEMQETIKRVIASDPEFVANLAVYARREFNMRSVAHVLVAHLAHEVAGKPYTRKAVKAISLRGDDVTEIMACYLSTFGKPIPNSLKKGISDAIIGFDAYTLAKYKGEGKAVKMRDLLRICRPTPRNQAQSDMWKRLLDGTLEIPYTWETQLSAHGNNRETWESLIESGKVGYMALLRNLRNIIKADPRNIDKVYALLENPEAVKRSKQLPFRFLAAYKEVKDIAGSRVLDVLENAIDASIANLPKLPGTTVIAVDTSGSMAGPVSYKSSTRCYEIAMLLGMVANRICENAHFFTFDTSIRKEAKSSRAGILSTVCGSCAGGGTDMTLPFQEMIAKRIVADRIIILSDNMNNSHYGQKMTQKCADDYRHAVNENLWVHAIDLVGYGTQQFHGGKTNIVAGWSEKVLDFILLAEQGAGSLEKTIQQYKWWQA